jgi:putative heme-binding domain-containing protein
LTAQRLLLERGDTAVAPALAFMLQSNRLAHARVHAAWCLSHLQALTETNLIGAIKDPHPAVQRNALRVVEERGGPVSAALEKAVVAQFKDTDARVRLAALAAASQSPLSKEGKHAVLKAFNEAKDGWSRSAVLGAARNAPLDFIDDAFNKPDDYKELVAFIIEGLAQQKQTELAADVIRMVARKPKEANKLRAAILEAFAKQLPDGFAPAWSEDVAKALKKLLEVESRTVRVAALPLAMHYESAEGAALDTAEVRKEVLGYLRGERLKDDQRTPYITGILAAPSLWPDGIDLADKWLAAGASKELQKDIVTQLGRTTAPAAGQTLVKNLKRLNTANRQLAVAALLKREEWALTLVEGIENETVSLNDVGVQGVDRLRVHPDKAVAERANRVLDAVQGPLLTEKDALIARFQRTLQTPGSARKGKELFQQNCGICHKFGRDGKDLGPELTGVGLHGAAVLLVHILDPNRVVEGNYVPYYLTTKKDEEYYGLLARENTESVVLRGVEGETEVRRSDIADLRSAARSIMPDGLESLGEQGIRDIIAFMTENTPRGFRTLDLSGAFTSDSRKGLYADPSDPPPLTFRKYGIVMVENVPFHVVSPTTAPGGRNVIVLRGGRGFAKTLPQRVEIPVGVQAKRIHILGGIAGWGYPEGDPSGYNAPAAKARILYADGKIEDVLWRNGEEFADCAGREEVSGSVQVPGLVEKGQVRWFALTPGQPVEIRKIVLESFNNHLAPTFIAMTAQVEE